MGFFLGLVSNVLANLVFWALLGSIFWFISTAAARRFSRFFGITRVNTVAVYLSNLWTPELSRTGKTVGYTIALHELRAAQAVDALFSSGPLRLPDLVRGLVDALWLREHVQRETAVSPLKAEDADLDRNLVIVGTSARNTVRARYVQAGLPTAIITGEDSPGYAGMPMDKVRSVTITRGAASSAVNFNNVNLALVEKCHDPDRARLSFSAWVLTAIARGQRQNTWCGTGNASPLSSATEISLPVSDSCKREIHERIQRTASPQYRNKLINMATSIASAPDGILHTHLPRTCR